MKTKQWATFLGLGLVWGSSFFWIKIALVDVGPMLLVAVRLLFGVLGLVIGVLVRKPAWPKNRRVWLMIALLGVINTAAPFSLISWGQQYIDSSVVSVLVSSVPVFTAILSLFFIHDDPFTPRKLIGVVVGFVGVLVLFWRGASQLGGLAIFGQLAVLGAAVLYSVSGILARREMRDIDPMIQSFGSLVIADAVMWLAVFSLEPVTFTGIRWLTWGALLWLGLFGSGLAYHLFYNLIAQIGATRTSLVSYLVPVVGLTLGVLILNEPFDPKLVLGGGLVLVSVLVVNKGD